jgi:hypothetical protein
MDEKFEKFIEVLRTQVQFPSYYYFKFIVKVEHQNEIEKLFLNEKIEFTPSKKGSYVSVSCHKLVSSPEEVVEIYMKAALIPGVISL